MRPYVNFTLRAGWVGISLLASSLAAAARDPVPRLDVTPSCESSARRLVFIDSSKEACIKHEMESHKVLVRHWSHYNKTDKTDCLTKITKGGPPSYTELLSCVETMQHARAVRKSL